MGQNGRKDDHKHSQEADTQSFEPRVHCPEVSSKAKAVHYCADQETITTVFRTIFSVNQLSLHGAVAEVCEENEAYHAGRPVVGERSCSSFVPSVIDTNVLLNNDDPTHKELLLQKIWRTN